jgi:glucose/mannose transport system substrate-binding protein
MKMNFYSRLLAIALSSIFLFTACSSSTAKPQNTPNHEAGKGQLEMFSWWTSGGEASGLSKMYDLYRSKYPGIEIMNATVAGGAGANAKAILKTRIMGGDPPDSFQVHAGQEVSSWVKAGKLEQIDDLYKSEGWESVFPKDLLDILKIDGHYYSVPVNIHRSNEIWYNKKIFKDNNITPPKTWDEFFAAADKLAAKKITPFALGDNGQWVDVQIFECILLSVFGQTAYNGLWTGKTDWNNPKVAQALEIFKKLLGYINSDHTALSWDQSVQYVIEGKAAMTLMGDWAVGEFISKNFTDYGWFAPPGTDGTFLMLSDSFAIPIGSKNPENAKLWLKLCGTAEAEDAFNPLKGSIPPRTDAGKGNYSEYLKAAIKEWSSNKLAPSCAHGAAAPEGWVSDITNAIIPFIIKKDVPKEQKSLVEVAKKNRLSAPTEQSDDTSATDAPSITPPKTTASIAPSAGTASPQQSPGIDTTTHVTIQEFNPSNQNSANSILANIRISNEGEKPLDMTKLTIRYYFNSMSSDNLKMSVLYANKGNTTVSGTFNKSKEANSYYAEIGFGTNAIKLKPNRYTDVNIKITGVDRTNLKQKDDYSFNSQTDDFIYWGRCPAFVDGKLAWGKTSNK